MNLTELIKQYQEALSDLRHETGRLKHGVIERVSELSGYHPQTCKNVLRDTPINHAPITKKKIMEATIECRNEFELING